MIAPWRGVIEEYREYLPVSETTPVVTLLEGNTPLLDAPRVAQRAGVAQVWLKVEGLNPTASFKDRGMTMAMSVAVERGAKLAICASTGNTSASAAAYAARVRGCRAAWCCPRATSRWASSRKRSSTARSWCRSTATSTTRSRSCASSASGRVSRS